MSSYSFKKVVFAATSGILQMNRTHDIDFRGDESVLDLPVYKFITGESRDVGSDVFIIDGLLLSELFTYHEESLEGIQESVLMAWLENRGEETELATKYISRIQASVSRRRRLFNSLMLSSLPEDDSVQLTEDECVTDIIKSYYNSCNYLYPFDNELMTVLHFLCRSRKGNGTYVLSHSILCGKYEK